MDIIGDMASAPQHDDMAVTFPEAKHGIAAVLLQFLEQGFVKGKIFFWRREREIEETKGAHGAIAWACRCVWPVRGRFRLPP